MAGGFELNQVHVFGDFWGIWIHNWCRFIFIVARLVVFDVEVGEVFPFPRVLPELTPIDCVILTHIKQVKRAFPLPIIRPLERRIQMHFHIQLLELLLIYLAILISIYFREIKLTGPLKS